MKKILAMTFLCVVLLLSGCNSWMGGSYHSVEPNKSRTGGGNADSVEVFSYQDICDALCQIIHSGSEKSVFYLSGSDTELLEQQLQLAISYVMANDPFAAYSVSDISYDFGTNNAKSAVSVKVTYIRSGSEILRIKKVNDMDEAVGLVTDALDKCASGTVLYISDYEETDVEQLVQDYVDFNPQTCMEMPQVAVSVYPETGRSRILEVSYSYQTSRDTLRNMQETVKPIFSAANLYVSGDSEDIQKLSLLYAFLMERFDYKIETSITPSYSLLRHGVGDCKAFAVVYAAMCRQLDLPCQIVSGTKGGEPWYWNVVLLDGEYQHLDLLRCNSEGRFFLRTEDEMTGYVWDYSAFSAENDT